MTTPLLHLQRSIEPFFVGMDLPQLQIAVGRWENGIQVFNLQNWFDEISLWVKFAKFYLEIRRFWGMKCAQGITQQQERKPKQRKDKIRKKYLLQLVEFVFEATWVETISTNPLFPTFKSLKTIVATLYQFSHWKHRKLKKKKQIILKQKPTQEQA